MRRYQEIGSASNRVTRLTRNREAPGVSWNPADLAGIGLRYESSNLARCPWHRCEERNGRALGKRKGTMIDGNVMVWSAAVGVSAEHLSRTLAVVMGGSWIALLFHELGHAFAAS